MPDEERLYSVALRIDIVAPIVRNLLSRECAQFNKTFMPVQLLHEDCQLSLGTDPHKNSFWVRLR